MKIRLKINYKKDGFYQIFPLLHLKNNNEDVIVVGFGTKNISLVFGNNDLEKYKQGGIVEWKLNKSSNATKPNSGSNTGSFENLYSDPYQYQIKPNSDTNISNVKSTDAKCTEVNVNSKLSPINKKFLYTAIALGAIGLLGLVLYKKSIFKRRW